jgi:uncharacterized delta-60 repeat protein
MNLRLYRKLAFLLVIINFTLITVAQSVNSEFNPIFEELPDLRSIEIQNDGKILVVGDFQRVNSSAINPAFYSNLARLNLDGTTDTDFVLSTELAQLDFYDVKLGLGDKIVLKSNNGLNDTRGIHIINSDGSLDTEFTIDAAIIRNIENAIAFDDGYIAIGYIQGLSSAQLFKLNADGSINEAFGTHKLTGGLNNYLSNIGDSELLIVSSFTDYDETAITGIIKVNSDGSLNSDFNVPLSDNSQNGNIQSITVQEDGKIYITGVMKEFAGKNLPAGMIRLNQDGSIDDSFNVNIAGNFTNSVRSLTLDGNGNIYGVGDVPENNLVIQKVFSLNADGTINQTFEPAKMVLKSYYNQFCKIILNSDGESFNLISGHRLANDVNRFGFVNIDLSGQVTEFNPAFSKSPTVRDAKLQSDGKILVVGDFFKVNDVFTGPIVRLNADGSTDQSFVLDNSLNQFLDSRVSSLAIQEDGKILVGGFLLDYFQSRILRLNENGSIDATFDHGSIGAISIDKGTTNIHIKEDGKIVIAGSQMFFPNSKLSNIGILNTDGSVDLSFDYTSLSTRSRINAFVPLEDGKFLIGGQDSAKGFMRLINSDGSLDNDFTSLTNSPQTIHGIGVVQGKLVYGGISYVGGQVNDPTSAFVADLNGTNTSGDLIKITGTFDRRAFYNTFFPLDEGFLVGGEFSSINGTEHTNLSKLEINGVVDETFSFNPNGRVDKLLRIDDDNILVFGDFAITHGLERFGAFKIRLSNTPPTIAGVVSALTTEEETTISISLENLIITDPDISPGTYTLTIAEGTNYTFDGLTITPVTDFNGALTVAIKVNDGEDDSEIFELTIKVTPVNDIPVISLFNGTATTPEETAIDLSIDDFSITDPDNTSTDFSLTILAGENYSVNGLNITPDTNFNGILTVSTIVNDRTDESQPFDVEIEVTAVNDQPVITGTNLASEIDNETALTINLTNLTVTDPDNNYPADFSLNISPGDNYTVDGNTISPTSEFIGEIVVPVTVNDGTIDSEPFNITIDVNMVTGIDFNLFSKQVSLYPNPTQDILNVKLDNQIFENITIRIIDANGNLVFNKNYSKKFQLFEESIALNTLAKGIYLVELIQGSGNISAKRVIKN